MSEWISIKDVIPATERRVIVFGRNDRAILSDIGVLGGSKNRTKIVFTDGNTGVTHTIDVSHWMPIPESPKGT